jgi:hypothetical protein
MTIIMIAGDGHNGAVTNEALVSYYRLLTVIYIIQG